MSKAQRSFSGEARIYGIFLVFVSLLHLFIMLLSHTEGSFSLEPEKFMFSIAFFLLGLALCFTRKEPATMRALRITVMGSLVAGLLLGICLTLGASLNAGMWYLILVPLPYTLVFLPSGFLAVVLHCLLLVEILLFLNWEIQHLALARDRLKQMLYLVSGITGCTLVYGTLFSAFLGLLHHALFSYDNWAAYFAVTCVPLLIYALIPLFFYEVSRLSSRRYRQAG